MDPSHIQKLTITAGIITVSSSRKQKEDKSGPIIMESLTKAGISVSYTDIVTDDIQAIQHSAKKAMEMCNCIILTGGTGITSDDCTIEAIEPLLKKKLDGFGELFRTKSYQEIGTRSLLSRAIGGIIDKKAIFCVPGSTAAVTLAVNEIIIPEIRHIITHASH
jgi:molybdopterin adenylyltransferase